MARFRIFLIGSLQPLDVDLPASGVAELAEIASRLRFIEGNMADADGDGVYSGVMIPSCRIQIAIETN